MKKFLSKEIHLHERLTINQLLALHTYQKNYHGDIYLLLNHKTITLENLANLVSLSLTITPKSKIQLIVEGENAQEALDELTECIYREVYIFAN
ncbi:hypothetical protein GI584_16455 [Gracilibacillus salitolerans]|uniref:HPr domain-containing protein n=1 Tax=Gracilibacillus salitolerans TaxID=2663022 RepID=A0A5Q2TNV9_9BACI|nr:HPr family phosphocarrier protein [Gracilibacillus salitolerans]QGH35540.1 hypothetical protein GI584_16455 [Gracilibacillus salitolerans]